MKSVACLLLVLLCLPASARAATVTQTGYWAFDEGAGATAADSTGAHNATLTGGAAWGLGAKGYALALNGTSAYADAGAPVIDTASSFTVSARVKLNRLDGTADLYGPAPQSAFDESSPTDRAFTYCLKQRPAADADVEARLKREIDFDPDVWILEVEDPAGRHFIETIVD